MKEWLKKVFSADMRSLALFRIGLGVLLILDILNRGRDLSVFYTNQGVLPLDVLQERFFTKGHMSIYFLNDSFGFVLTIFVLTFIFAFMLLIGYKTKLATIVSWFFLISIQNRNPIVLQGGDILFRLLLFWAIFLPLGRYWSIDNSKKGKNKNPEEIFCIGGIVLLLQLILMYISTALLKTGKEWIPDGSAVYYALSIDQFTTSFGYLILSNYALTKFLTYFIFGYWFIGSFLLLISWNFEKVRIFAISIFIFIQLGMVLSMMLGLFSWIAIIAMFAFLPSGFWDRFLPSINVNLFKKEKIVEKNYFYLTKFSNILILVLVIFLFIYGFLWNLGSFNLYNIPEEARFIGHSLRFDQKWNMFSPKPLVDDGWFVVIGKFVDGSKWDLFQNKEVSFEKPEMVSKTYKNQRWRKYMMNLWLRSHSAYREYYVDYLCRAWEGDLNLESIEVIYMKEDTLLNYKVSNPQRITIFENNCK